MATDAQTNTFSGTGQVVEVTWTFPRGSSPEILAKARKAGRDVVRRYGDAMERLARADTERKED